MLRAAFLTIFILTFCTLAGAQAPDLDVNEPVLVGDSGSMEVKITVFGSPFEHYAVAWSLAGSGLVVNGVEFELGEDALVIDIGQLGADGVVTVPFTPPSGEEKIYLQGATSPDPSFAFPSPTPGKVLVPAGPPGTGTIFMDRTVFGELDAICYRPLGTDAWSGQCRTLEEVERVVPIDSTAQNLTVAISPEGPQWTLPGQSVTATLLVDGVPTGITCTVSFPGTSCSSVFTHDISVGSIVAVMFEKSGLGFIVRWAIVLK